MTKNRDAIRQIAQAMNFATVTEDDELLGEDRKAIRALVQDEAFIANRRLRRVNQDRPR